MENLRKQVSRCIKLKKAGKNRNTMFFIVINIMKYANFLLFQRHGSGIDLATQVINDAQKVGARGPYLRDNAQHKWYLGLGSQQSYKETKTKNDVVI